MFNSFSFLHTVSSALVSYFGGNYIKSILDVKKVFSLNEKNLIIEKAEIINKSTVNFSKNKINLDNITLNIKKGEKFDEVFKLKTDEEKKDFIKKAVIKVSSCQENKGMFFKSMIGYSLLTAVGLKNNHSHRSLFFSSAAGLAIGGLVSYKDSLNNEDLLTYLSPVRKKINKVKINFF